MDSHLHLLRGTSNGTSGQRNLTKGHIAILSPLVLANGFVRPWPPSNTCFLGRTWVYPKTAANTVNAFRWGWQPPKLPFVLRHLDPDLIHGPLGPPKSVLRLTSRLVQAFIDRLFNWVDLIKPVSNVPPSVRPQKRFFDFNEIGRSFGV